MKELLFCVVVLFSAGCAPDPLGFTERTQIRAQAAVDIATQERLAKEAEARAIVNAEIARQAGAQFRLMFMPVIIGVLGLIAIVLLIIYWVGRLSLERQRQYALGTPRPPLPLPRVVTQAYKARGCDIVLHNGDWWPVHKESGKMLPKPARKVLEVGKCR